MLIRRAKTGDEKNIASVIINTWKYAYTGIVPDDFLMSLTPDKHEQLIIERTDKRTKGNNHYTRK